MKTAINQSWKDGTPELRAALEKDFNVVAQPRLMVDWNMNLYHDVTADNVPNEDTEDFDKEFFPAASMVQPQRPNKGINKAIINHCTASVGYVSKRYPQYYVASQSDKYKYWVSPRKTGEDKIFPLHTDGQSIARPRINYTEPVQSNKIVIKFENSWAQPNDYLVMIRETVDGEWRSVSNTPYIDPATGVATLYLFDTGWYSGTHAPPAEMYVNNAAPVAGIQVRVNSMRGGYNHLGTRSEFRYKNNPNQTTYTDGRNSLLSVIAIEAHLEKDFTDRMISAEADFQMSEASDVYPIGTITSNTASVTLNNYDGLLFPEHPGPYGRYMEGNAEFSLYYDYFVGNETITVQEFFMYSGEWTVNDDRTVSVSLEDCVKFLQEQKPHSFMVEDKTVYSIIARVLDSVGFNNYELDEEDVQSTDIIPIFWVTGEDPVWTVLDELASATQTAIYVDNKGVIQIRTREMAFKDTAPVDWKLVGQRTPDRLPDIASLSADASYGTNKVSVTYQSTKWKTTKGGIPAMSKVWEPDTETVVVRACPLAKSIDSNKDEEIKVFFNKKDLRLWPYEGMFEIDGEVMKYQGKEFEYYTFPEKIIDDTIRQVGWEKHRVMVKDAKEKRKYNKMSPASLRGRNHFTGAVKVRERGVYNTPIRKHDVNADGYETWRELWNTGPWGVGQQSAGFRHNKQDSTVSLSTPGQMNDPRDFLFAYKGNQGMMGFKLYGTRMKFSKNKSRKTQRAGIAIRMQGTNGYFIELCMSNSLTAADRSERNEVHVYSKKGPKLNILDKGKPIAIAPGLWYDLDVQISDRGGADFITVWLNGTQVIDTKVKADDAFGDSARIGMFARGKTEVEYEYIYGVNRTGKEPLDDFGFYDLVYGGVRGSQWLREIVWEWKTRWRRCPDVSIPARRYKKGLYYFDEFGPYVREVREFKVDYDPAPVRYSYLFNTNEWYSAVVQFVSTPFNSKFIIANASRENAVLHGEDSLMFAGSDNKVTQVLTVLGQDLVIGESEEVTRKNKKNIRNRGEVSSEFESDWIQSKAMARNISDWVAQHWSDHLDQVTVESFGNPLLELGDLVSIDFAEEGYAPDTHRYFVTGISTNWENGLSTTLTLRRNRKASEVDLSEEE